MGHIASFSQKFENRKQKRGRILDFYENEHNFQITYPNKANKDFLESLCYALQQNSSLWSGKNLERS